MNETFPQHFCFFNHGFSDKGMPAETQQEPKFSAPMLMPNPNNPGELCVRTNATMVCGG